MTHRTYKKSPPMNPSAPLSASAEIEAHVARFEEALRAGDRDPARHLPAPDHPLYATILSELIRTDLEYGWEHGPVRRLAEYRRQFPDFFADRDQARAVAFE